MWETRLAMCFIAHMGGWLTKTIVYWQWSIEEDVPTTRFNMDNS